MRQEYKIWKSEDVLSNDFGNVFEEQQDLIDNRNKRLLTSDTRPQLGLINKEYAELISKDEDEKVIKKIRKNEKEIEDSKKTIMDTELKDIMGNTSEIVSNFWDDYKIKLVEAEINIKNKLIDSKNYKPTLTNIIQTHLIAFVNYMNEDSNMIYIGIFISIIGHDVYNEDSYRRAYNTTKHQNVINFEMFRNSKIINIPIDVRK